jgi:hypothetical protein
MNVLLGSKEGCQSMGNLYAGLVRRGDKVNKRDGSRSASTPGFQIVGYRWTN